MDAFGLGAVGADHEEVLVSLQRVGGDQAGVGERRLAQVPEQAGQLDDVIVGKPVRRSFPESTNAMSATPSRTNCGCCACDLPSAPLK